MSIVVITLHKSASMFLFSYFKDVAQFKNIKFYSDNVPNLTEFKTHDHSTPFIVSPIRLYVPGKNVRVDEINKPFLCYENLDRKFIIHVRNPLDILVSEFYSYGFMHIDDERNTMKTLRETYIKDITIDEYCLKSAIDFLEKYKYLYYIISQNIDKPNFVMSSYSEMKNNYKIWNNKMFKILDLKDSERVTLHRKYREEFELEPLDNKMVISKEVNRHIRNGSDNQYSTELQPETIAKLVELFQSIIPENIKHLPDLKF